MRDLYLTTKLVNCITGVVLASAATARTQVGIAIDTLGFREMLAMLCVGQAASSTGVNVDIYMRGEECDSANGTYAAINDGAYTGSCVSTTLALVACTSAGAYNTNAVYMTKIFERLNDGIRKRFVRFTAYAVGSAPAVHVPYTIAVLLGAADDTDTYISQPTTIATGHNSFNKPSAVLGTAMA